MAYLKTKLLIKKAGMSNTLSTTFNSLVVFSFFILNTNLLNDYRYFRPTRQHNPTQRACDLIRTETHCVR